MNFAVLAFVVGVIWVQQWSRLPVWYEWLILSGMVFLSGTRRYWSGLALLFGVLWASIYGEWRLSGVLLDELQGKDIQLQGYVASLPQIEENRQSFDFSVTQAQPGIPDKLHLNWYDQTVDLQAGQTLEMTVRLKKPHGRSNPGGYDYEGWLFTNHIGATGYVRTHPAPKLIQPALEFDRYIAVSRQLISERLRAALPNSQQLGVIQALTIGNQTAISQQQWDVYRKTGVVHLMVISGSHISLIAGLCFISVRRIWARWGGLQVSPQNMAALMAWLVALLYAALSGFSVPTQRAVLMLTVGLWSVVWQRHTTPWQILCLALLAVVGFDPLSVVSVGFWLSFVAVGLLIFISAGRLGKTSYWREALKLHLVMAIGLAPLLMVFFQQVSLIAPLANWIAVPLIGGVITPLALLATVIGLFSTDLATPLFWPIDRLLQGLEWVLKHLAVLPVASLNCTQPTWYGLLFAAVGAVWLFAPRGMPGRFLAPYLFLPLFFVGRETPKNGEIWFSVLDVGQGLAAVVQTEHHTLVFDTGAKYSEQSDMGDSVVLPFLRYQGVSRLDTLVISHGDNDHSGGAASLLTELPAEVIYSSVAEWAEQPKGHYCRAGQQWHWDGVEFTVLAPTQRQFDSENDQSCVLKITGLQQSILLTGDIELSAENQLVEQYGSQLFSTVLIAPHHGSKTSSSYKFLQQVQPKWVFIPAGYLNRFGFPHRQVLQRYKSMDLKAFSTGEQGAISVRVHKAGLDIELSRQKRKRYWMQDIKH